MTDSPRTAGRPPAPSRSTGSPWIYGAAALGLLAGFLVAVRSVLSPLVLYVLVLYVLWPLMGRRTYRRLAGAATLAFALWVLDTTGLLLAPFILAVILAYILDPLVDRLQADRLPRSVAIGFLVLPLLGLVALVALVVAPAVARQVSEFIANVPEHLDAVTRWLEGLRAWVVRLGVPGVDEASVPRLRDLDAEAIVRWLQGRQRELGEGGLQAALGIGRGLGAILAAIAYLVLLPILSFYLLRDWNRILERVRELIPGEQRERVVEFAARFDALLSRYLRGQLLLALLVGFMFWLGFTLVGFPYALLLGVVAAVFNLVPYLGMVVTLGLALIVSLFSGAIVASLGKLAVVLVVEQVVEQVLGPLIVGESVGLHPVWVILALALFGFFFGFVGLLLAVPAAVFLKLVVESWLTRYRASAFYGGGPTGARDAGPDAGAST